jgi:hypothetical protein
MNYWQMHDPFLTLNLALDHLLEAFLRVIAVSTLV